MTYIWLDKKFQQKLDLVKGLISVEGNIVFGNTGFEKNSVTLYGLYYGDTEPKVVKYILTKDHIEMLDSAQSIDEVIEVYRKIGYFKEVG
ncbi:hypothetical protein AAGG74_15400 [Bacillus mexicanus]|uniref:hypothetical protein n=1 Tax=Bacillus mexicanus TaxID=2834415 RepID=UPI003D1F76D7